MSGFARNCLRCTIVVASLFVPAGGTAGPAQDPKDRSCAELLTAIYSAEAKEVPERPIIKFDDGTILKPDDEQLKAKVQNAKGVLQVSHQADYKRMLNLVKRTRNRDLLIAWSASGDLDAGVLKKTPVKISVLNGVPTSQEGFSRVYDSKTPVHPSTLKQYDDRVKKLTGCASLLTPGPVVHSEDLQTAALGGASTIADHTQNFAKSQEADSLTLIVAHIDETGNLRFPDGSKLLATEIRGPGQVWIIGCKSLSHLKADLSAGGKLLVTSKDMDVVHALDVTKKIVDRLVAPVRATSDGKGERNFRDKARGDSGSRQSSRAGTKDAEDGPATYEDALRFAQNQGFDFLMALTGVMLIFSLEDEDEDEGGKI